MKENQQEKRTLDKARPGLGSVNTTYNESGHDETRTPLDENVPSEHSRSRADPTYPI